MSLVFSFERQHLYGSTIYDTIGRYIPKTLLQSLKLPVDTLTCRNDEELVQAILSNSDNMLRMYGTAEELLLDLKKWQNFPLSHRRLSFDPKEPYTKIPIVYRNMDGVPFMNKADTFCLVPNIVYSDLFDSLESYQLFNSMLAIVLKSDEEKIIGICEFFKYDKNWLSKLRDEFLQLHQKFLGQESSTIREDWNFENALEMFKTLLPVWKEQEYCEFEKDLKNFFDSKSGNFNDVSVAIRSIVDCWKSYILLNPDKILPYDKETNPNSPIVVRVFESHGVQFVMKCELFNAINIRNPNSKRLECKEIDRRLMTMSYEKVQRKYKDRIGNIEFIKYPIQRTTHRAVPIMTPSGGLCILATDFLFEMLNELIFTHRIFQKIGSENSNIVRRFFTKMTHFFPPHHKSIFFVTLEERYKRIEESVEFWNIFENVQTKHVRNVEEDGFTVQNLKDELEYLGLTELFPEIQNYAEAVYSEVFEAKNEKVLRTCDLFKAIEKCLLNCIFKRFPMLLLFLHTQKSCNLFPELECSFCISPNDNRFENTNWKEHHYKKTLSTYLESDPENKYLNEVTLPDRTTLTNSYNRFFNMEQIRKHNIKYFIYDPQDLKYFSKNSKHLKPRKLRDECRYNLDAFQRFYPEKKFYIRTIPSMREMRDESKRVFTEEVLDLIPVALRQQNTPISENDDRLAKYRYNWETNDKDLEATISLTEFWYILEEFDVDKTRITIIPDPVYELTIPKMIEDLRMHTLNVISPRGELVMRIEQAVFHIFEVVYCSVNWTRDFCKTHENCLKKLKDRIICSMRTYTEMEEGTYVSVEHVESVINQLKNHCSFQLQSNTQSPLVELQHMKFDAIIPKNYYTSMCRKFGLTEYLSTVPVLKPVIPVFSVRIHYLSAWLKEFRNFGTLDLHDLILDEMGFRSFSLATNFDFENLSNIHVDESIFVRKPNNPLEKKSNVTFAEEETAKKTKMEESERSKKASKITVGKVTDLKTEKDSEANKKEVTIQKPSMPEEDLEVKKLTSEDAQKTSTFEKASKVEIPYPDGNQKTSVPQKAPEMEPPTSDDVQRTSPIEKSFPFEINQSKCCTKCLRTSEMCNEAKKELTKTQNRLEKYEKKARRTEEVEIQMREMEAEMKKMKKELKEREVEMQKRQKVIEEQESKLLKMEASETRMRLTEKNHSIYEKEQSQLIDELTTQLENQNEKIQLMDLQLQQNEESLKLEIREKQRGFEELRAALNIMSTEMESIQSDNRNLRDRIQSIPEAPPTQTLPESPSEEQPNHHRFALFRFQRIKDSLYHKKQLNQAKEMVEKMKSCTDLVEIHQIADYEYYQFEGKLLKYVKEVELNIQRIKETCDVSTVTPLPDSPEFSNRFMNLYWRIINNQPITSSEIEVSDSECFICYVEMASDQKTLQCEECKKVTHFECASKWLKTHRSCPHCRREMLNPEEFPNLGQ
ncbi:unnamed protein product [Caenorhabditis nigoni]